MHFTFHNEDNEEFVPKIAFIMRDLDLPTVQSSVNLLVSFIIINTIIIIIG